MAKACIIKCYSAELKLMEGKTRSIIGIVKPQVRHGTVAIL